MASNDYYNTAPHQPSSQYQTHNPDPAPAYQSKPPSLHPSQRPVQAASPVSPIQPGVSPFVAPFDDNVYPMGGHDPYRQDSQNTLGSDSRYYGQQGGRQESQNSFSDNLPLRNYPQPPAKNSDVDHVYDAPAAAPVGLEEGRKRRSGLGGYFKSPKKKIPWVVYTLTLIQVIVFIVEIVKNAQLTGSPIQTKPFNPMIGPTPWVTISMGSRYVPCMHYNETVTNAVGETISDGVFRQPWGCPNTVDFSTTRCQLNELCGFGAKPFSQTNKPDQWFRFILPMFLHAGIIHIGFNMLLQNTLGREMEISIGSIRFFLVYISSGIFGFVLGGNFAAPGISSTGASGSLFGILALTLLDLLYTWKERRSPLTDLAFIALDVVISFVLGLLPGLDNFSHIGGFLMGLALGICILHSPNALRKRIKQDDPPYTPVATSGPNQGLVNFAKSPVGFFKGRKPAWWAWWLVRVASLVVVFIVFILLLHNFYGPQTKCSWCKYVSCIDIHGWCDIGKIGS